MSENEAPRTARTDADMPAETPEPSPSTADLPPGTGQRSDADQRSSGPAPRPATNPAPNHHRRGGRSFTPRRGRVTDSQGLALERLWPAWGLEVDGSRLDLRTLFDTLPSDAPIVLEIGFGMGEATAQMAVEDPGTGILAVDVHTPGHGRLLRLAERNGSRNVRVANGDAVILLSEMLEWDSLAGLRLYFPDPWPKKRHHKRRIVQPEFLDLAAGPLTSGALVELATDWEPYAEHMLEVLNAHPDYVNTAPDGGYAPDPGSRAPTRFEGRGVRKGHQVRDLRFRRR